MLVLSRKKNESIILDRGIRIRVLDVRGDVVRLGIEAPREVAVYRSEVWTRIQAESRIKSPPGGACLTDLAAAAPGTVVSAAR